MSTPRPTTRCRPLRIIGKLLTATRRAHQEHAAFIRLIRQAAALLAAGRPLQSIWSELAAAYQGCQAVTVPDIADPGCCLHHVLRCQDTAGLLQEPYFAGITAPGRPADWQQLSATLALAEYTGMPLASVLNRLADALEAGEDADQARQAASAGPKATARLLAWLPVAGLGIAHLLGASLTELLSTPTGWVLALSGVALAVIGRAWSQRMIRTAETP